MRKVSYSGKSILFLKICIVLLLVVSTVMGLMLIFAPGQLQRLGDLFAPRHQSLTIATAPEGGHYLRLSELMRQEIDKGRNVSMTVLRTQGSLENLELLEQGKADFALVQGGLDHDRLKGMSAVAQVSWQYVHILVPFDSPMRELRDLKGKKVSLGPPLSGNANLGKNLFDFFWPGGGVEIVHSRVADLSNDLAEGKIDAALLVYDFHANVVENLLRDGEYRILNIPESKAIADAIPGCFPTSIPRGTYGPNRTIPAEEDLRTLKVKTLLITRTKTSRFAVERMLQVLYSPSYLKQARLNLVESQGRNVKELPLHSAARRYYRRNDPITADMFEIGSFFLAMILFLGSALSFVSRRGHERHLDRMRERIVPFFEELLRCSEALARVEDVPSLEELLASMMATQRRAENAWLRGELDTEHMENLYAIYGIHCSNAFQKMQQLLLEKRLKMLQSLDEMEQPPAARKN